MQAGCDVNVPEGGVESIQTEVTGTLSVATIGNESRDILCQPTAADAGHLARCAFSDTLMSATGIDWVARSM